jgi:hypothetical protein
MASSRERILAESLHFSKMDLALPGAGEQIMLVLTVKIHGENTMTRFILVAILVATSTLVTSNVAIAASQLDQPQNEAKATSVSMPDSDFTQFRHAANSSHSDRPVPFYEAQASNVCQTPMGWCYVPVAPSGTPC